jgi:group I intron endonuclease
MAQSNQGIYKLVYLPTGHFYIGATANLRQRWFIHQSMMKAGKATSKIQELYDKDRDLNSWVFEILEFVKQKRSLDKRETSYIKQHFNNPLCLNTYSIATSGKRGSKINNISKYKIAQNLLGKNTPDGIILRPANLVFISPDGTEYQNVKSVKQFAKEHNLGQSSMNQLANGQANVVDGWIAKGGELPKVGRIIHYWPESRIRQFYPEYTILGPDNKEYKTFHLHGFQEQHNCTVALENNFGDKNRKGVKRELNGLNKYGQGWRLKGVPTYQITWEGKTYHNVLSVAMFCYTFGIRNDRLKNAFTKPTKYTRKYSIVEDTI